METGKVIHGNFLDSELPKGSAGLIIADPPYYRVKGEFDFCFESRAAYLEEAAKWMDKCACLLASNGTLIWYCSDTMLGHMLVMLEERFHVLNTCTIVKTNGIQNTFASPEAVRSFFVNDERFVVCESKGDAEGAAGVLERNAYRFELGKLHTRVCRPVIDYLNGERERAGYTVAQVCKAFGMFVPGHWFTRGSQWHLPTPEHYARLRALLNSGGNSEYLRREYEELRKEYEELRKEYEELRRPFRMQGRQSDVFEVTVSGGYCKRVGHPTAKPESLTETLIRSTTRPGQLVVVPFAGSGTECYIAKRLGLDYVGYEIDATYCERANARCSEICKLLL